MFAERACSLPQPPCVVRWASPGRGSGVVSFSLEYHWLARMQSSMASSRHFLRKSCPRVPSGSSSRMLSLFLMMLMPRILRLRLRTLLPHLSRMQPMKVRFFWMFLSSTSSSFSSLLTQLVLMNLLRVRLQKQACLKISLSIRFWLKNYSFYWYSFICVSDSAPEQDWFDERRFCDSLSCDCGSSFVKRKSSLSTLGAFWGVCCVWWAWWAWWWGTLQCAQCLRMLGYSFMSLFLRLWQIWFLLRFILAHSPKNSLVRWSTSSSQISVFLMRVELKSEASSACVGLRGTTLTPECLPRQLSSPISCVSGEMLRFSNFSISLSDCLIFSLISRGLISMVLEISLDFSLSIISCMPWMMNSLAMVRDLLLKGELTPSPSCRLLIRSSPPSSLRSATPTLSLDLLGLILLRAVMSLAMGLYLCDSTCLTLWSSVVLHLTWEGLRLLRTLFWSCSMKRSFWVRRWLNWTLWKGWGRRAGGLESLRKWLQAVFIPSAKLFFDFRITILFLLGRSPRWLLLSFIWHSCYTGSSPLQPFCGSVFSRTPGGGGAWRALGCLREGGDTRLDVGCMECACLRQLLLYIGFNQFYSGCGLISYYTSHPASFCGWEAQQSRWWDSGSGKGDQ